MTREEASQRFPNHPQPAPPEFAGQWVAWNTDRSDIVAHGGRFDEVRAKAIAAGCPEPLLQRVLGHQGFLDYFTATFRGEDCVLDLEPNDGLPRT